MARDLELKLVIKADGSAAVREIKTLDGQVGKLGDGARGAGKDVGALGGGITKLAAAAGAAVSIGALASAFIDYNREAQTLKATLATVTGSVEAAEDAWGRLETFAAQTPYTLDQSVTAFTRLKSLGLDPSERALRSYGNTASAMGKDLIQFVEAVADATVGEFERLKEFGIKASAQGNQVALTFQGVTTTIARDAGAIQDYLLAIGETQFAGGMQRQAETIGGALSNLEDAAGRFWRALGDSGAADVAEAAIRGATEALEGLTDKIEAANREIPATVNGLKALYEIAARRLPGGNFLDAIVTGIDEVQRLFRLGEAALALPYRVALDALQDLGRSAPRVLDDVQGRTADWTRELKRGAEEIKRIDAELARVRSLDEATGGEGIMGRLGGEMAELIRQRDQVMSQMATYAQLIQQEEGLTHGLAGAVREYGAEIKGVAELRGKLGSAAVIDILDDSIKAVRGSTEELVGRLDLVGPAIEKWADYYKVPLPLAYSIAAVESGFNRFAKSNADAHGVMQITSDHAKTLEAHFRKWGVTTISANDILTDWNDNVRAGVFNMRLMLDQGRSFEEVAKGYNAGWGAATKELGNLSQETQNYVPQVLAGVAALAAAAGDIDLAAQAAGSGAEATRRLSAAQEEANRIVAAGRTPVQQFNEALERARELKEQGLLTTAELATEEERLRGVLIDQLQTIARAAPEFQRYQAAQQALAQTAETLIARYLPAKAAAEDFALAQHALDYAVQQGAISTQQATEILKRYKQELDFSSLTDGQRRLAAFADDVGLAFGSAFGEAARDMDNAADAGKRLLERLRDLVIQLLIVEPIADAVGNVLRGAFNLPAGSGAGSSAGSSLLSALGSFLKNLFKFEHGGLLPAAALPHGVYNQPTLFPMGIPGRHAFAAGVGLLGEAGPEAVLPLKRGRDGKLGVTAEGGGLNVNIYPAPGYTSKASLQGNTLTIQDVEQYLSNEAVRGGGIFDRSLQAGYGLTRGGR